MVRPMRLSNRRFPSLCALFLCERSCDGQFIFSRKSDWKKSGHKLGYPLGFHRICRPQASMRYTRGQRREYDGRSLAPACIHLLKTMKFRIVPLMLALSPLVSPFAKAADLAVVVAKNFPLESMTRT